jgi:hypothetical protein
VPKQLPLSCKCGQVRGLASQLDPHRLSHVICHCDDCQAYAHFLQRSDLLDTYGGTEIFQMTPAQLTLSEGVHQVRCMRLSPKGLLRWYAGCCNTPIANTMPSPKVPFMGAVTAFIEASALPRKDDALGPVIVRAFGKFAKGGIPPGGHAKAPASYIFRSLRIFLGAWLKGQHVPSPFFDGTGKPVVQPKVISKEERERLRGMVNGVSG